MILVWAHRGASAYAPENTLEAFSLAVKMGADGVELDVHLTKDGEVAVSHDEAVDRVSDGHGLIADMTLSELKRLDFGVHFDAYRGARLPTLGEVYALLAPTGLSVNVELKTNENPYPGIEEKCAILAEKYGMTKRVLYSSFNFESLDRIHAVDPALPTALLYGKHLPRAAAVAKRHGAFAVHPYYENLYQPRVMDSLRASGLRVHPWTVDDADEIKRLAALGIDAVISNAPDVALRALGR